MMMTMKLQNPIAPVAELEVPAPNQMMESVEDLTDRMLLGDAPGDAGVLDAKRHLADVVQETGILRQRRAELTHEFHALHDPTRRPGDRRKAQELANRSIEIQNELADIETKLGVLAAAKAAAYRGVEAAVNAARRVEMRELSATAREIVSRMAPLAEALAELSDELEALRRRAGHQASWPLPFAAGSPLTVERWLEKARTFVNDKGSVKR